jgi:ADP-ribose pyrophosphatase YjhB (NUDIX family)
MRKTKVIGFSVPPEIYKDFEKFSRSTHKTKSEFFRELINHYFESVKKVESFPSSTTESENSADLAKILKTFWLLKSQSPLQIIIIGLGIIVNEKGEVLIGARTKKDLIVKNLSWVFPGGKMESLDFSAETKKGIKKETNLDVEIKTLITSRIHPDVSLGNTQVIALYFYCQVISKGNFKAGGDLKKLLWVKPTDVFKYFTTSTSDEVTKFLVTLEESSKRD